MAWAPPRVKARRNAYGVSRIKRDSYSNSNTQTDWWAIQKEVLARDGNKCQKVRQGRLCGLHAVTVHHIIPLSRGGTTTKRNLISICKGCHEDTHPHLRRAR